jgi:Glycosyltransferase family 87
VVGTRESSGWNPTAGVILITICLILIAFRVSGLPTVTDYSHLFAHGVFPDSAHERATAWEAVWGDPYRPLAEIMPEHDYKDWVTGGPSPRPPSALLLQTPLLLISHDWLMPVATGLTVLLLVWIGWLSLGLSGLSRRQAIWAVPLLLLSLPVISSLLYSPIMALLTVALLIASWRYRDRRWAGVLLGLSTALRLWPGFVIAGFWLNGRRRLALSAAVTFAVLSLAGLMLPGITLAGTIASLTAAKSAWLNHNMNSSLVVALWPVGVPPRVSVVAVCCPGLWLAYRIRAHAVPITIVVALVASPLSWPAYALATLPILGLYARHESPWPVVGLMAGLATWSLWPTSWIGRIHFAALVVVLILVARPRTIDLSELEPVTLEPVDGALPRVVAAGESS